MACRGWLDREFLVRDALTHGGELESPTAVRMPDGQVVDVPAPCDHPAEDCPPLPLHSAGLVAA